MADYPVTPHTPELSEQEILRAFHEPLVDLAKMSVLADRIVHQNGDRGLEDA